MAAASLPTGFWVCLIGGVLAGGIALAALWWFLRRIRLKRLRSFAGNQSGTTIVEFPFALIILVLCCLLTWQLGFMVSAYLVVDYAAFAAVRSAIVVISDENDDEAKGTIKTVALDDGDKGEDITDAARFVCYPISGVYEGGGWASAVDILDDIAKIPGSDLILDKIDPPDFARRFLWTRENTRVRMVVGDQESGEASFSGGDMVTVEVSHDFSLRISIARRVFGSHDADRGYTTTLTGRATMQYEGYPEQVPEGAP